MLELILIALSIMNVYIIYSIHEEITEVIKALDIIQMGIRSRISKKSEN